MAILTIYANSASNGVAYAITGSFGVESSHVFLTTTVSSGNGEEAALETLLPKAKSLATEEVKGGTKKFMRWLNTP
jgi:hypothetical protein